MNMSEYLASLRQCRSAVLKIQARFEQQQADVQALIAEASRYAGADGSAETDSSWQSLRALTETMATAAGVLGSMELQAKGLVGRCHEADQQRAGQHRRRLTV